MGERTPERVSALVVSGFLGAGKTSLVRELLEDAQRSGRRVAVISIELGELGVAAALLGERAYAELAGGCVCCSLSNELVDTLELLRERVAPERVIVETSGVALPWDTLLHFERDSVREWIADAMAVVVVNAEQVAEGRDLAGTFEDQITCADLLVLNQIDRVRAEALPEVEARLRALEPEAPIVRSIRGRVAPELFFPPEPPGRRSRAPRAPRPHRHDFAASVIEIEAGITPEELALRLRETGALRAKGFVRTSEGVRLAQVVGRRVELEVPFTAPDASVLGRVVVVRRSG